MRTYLVSYDLGVPEGSEDYKRVIDYIKSFTFWAKPLQSVWFVVSSTKTAGGIRDDLKGLTDPNDKILVIDVSADLWAVARLEPKVTEWMKSNI